MLKNGLNKVVKIYVPSTVEVNKVVSEQDRNNYLDMVLTELSVMFGGATMQEAQGTWLSNEHGLVREQITLVYSFTNELDDHKTSKLIELCDKLKEGMKQEAISLELDGSLYFI